MGLETGVITIVALGVGVPLLASWRARLLDLGKPSIIAMAVGASLLVLTLIIQPLLYRLPAHAGVFVTGWALLAYMALVSGLLQEGLKLSVVTKGFESRAAALGFGFGAAEVFLVVIPSLLVAGRLGAPVSLGPAGGLGWEAFLLSSWERLNATFFHIFTSMLLARPAPRPLFRWLSLGLLHAGVNFSAMVAVRFFGVVDPNPLLVFYAAFTLLDIFLATKAVRGRDGG